MAKGRVTIEIGIKRRKENQENPKKERRKEREKDLELGSKEK